MEIALLGMFRVGTNYVRTVLENNYNVYVKYNALGWKHGVIPTYAKDSGYDHPDIKVLVVVKNPLSAIRSWWDYYSRVGKNIKTSAVTFEQFLKSPVVFFDEWNPSSPEYWFSTPIDMWNGIVWNHLSFSEKVGGHVVRYEDILSDPEIYSSEIARKLGVLRNDKEFYIPKKVTKNMNDSGERGGAKDYLNNGRFSKKDYFLNGGYLESYSSSMIDYARKNLDQRLLKKLCYHNDLISGKSHTGALRDSGEDIEVFTLASDERIGDLANLLESTSCFRFKVNIIPYNNNVTKVEELAGFYGARIIEPDLKFDEMGKNIFGSSNRRGREDCAWRLFRKFNALGYGYSKRALFIDANCILLKDFREDLARVEDDGVVFGHRSNPGNNFEKWGECLFSRLSPNLGAGFGADFWFVPNSDEIVRILRDICDYPGLKKIISNAPEQGVLNLAILLSKRNVTTVDSIGEKLRYLVVTKNTKKIVSADDGIYYKGNKVGVVKWTGDYHTNNYEMKGVDLYSDMANKVLTRIERSSDLYDSLSGYYKKVLGFDVGLESSTL